MTRFLKGTDRPLAEAYQLALLDLDGVVYRGKNPVEYAADSIRAAEAAGMTIEYTTNNSSRFQHVVADQLKGFGLDVEPWQGDQPVRGLSGWNEKHQSDHGRKYCGGRPYGGQGVARRRARTGIGHRAFAR